MISLCFLLFICTHTVKGSNDVLGYGYDLTASDLWTFKGLVGRNIFTDFTKESIVNADCPHISETINENYTSTNSWYQEFSKNIGLTHDLSWHGLDLSVGTSYGQADTYTWWDELVSTYVDTYNIQNCQAISSNWSPYKHLSSDFVDTLTSLPLYSDDEDVMKLWESAFVHRFGTHYAVQSLHGAQIKVLTSVEASCETSMDCLVQETCLSLAFVDLFGSSLCKSQGSCKVSDGCTSTLNIGCTVNGGDPMYSSANLCTDKATSEELNTFLSSGNMNSSTSVIGITFQSLADLVSGAGFYAEYSQVSQAIAYSGCNYPFSWQIVEDKGQGKGSKPFPSHACQCALTCQNNGILDPNTCSCNCSGDKAHGWKGM